MPTTMPRQHEAPGQGRSKPRILVVAPKVDNELVLLIAQCGYDVDFVSASDAELKHRVTEPYDLLCIEVEPDDSHGFDLISVFQLENPEAEVVTMTGDNQKRVEARARALKVRYHLVYPYYVKEIISIFSHLAARKNKNKEQGNT